MFELKFLLLLFLIKHMFATWKLNGINFCTDSIIVPMGAVMEDLKIRLGTDLHRENLSL